MCICVCTLTRDSFAVELTDQLHRLSVIRTPYACAHLFRMLSMSVSLPVFPKKNPKKQTINCIAMNGIHLLTKMSQTMEENSRRKCAIAYSQTKELNSESCSAYNACSTYYSCTSSISNKNKTKKGYKLQLIGLRIRG